jgi:hypothetical protein
MPPESPLDTPSPASNFHLENKINPARPVPSVQSVPPASSKPEVYPLPTPITEPRGGLHGAPSPQAQSWGVVISIIIIVLMIVIGAFYAWGKRISQNIPPAIPEVIQ